MRNTYTISLFNYVCDPLLKILVLANICRKSAVKIAQILLLTYSKTFGFFC